MDRLLAVLCGACLLLSAASALKHHILTKSWTEAQSDCLQYLKITPSRAVPFNEYHYEEDQTSKQLIFCIVVNLRIYESKQNVLRVDLLGQFFNPDVDDTLYVNRTNECLLRVKNPPKEDYSYRMSPYVRPIESMYEMFRCFYFYYGNLNRDAPKLPLTALELQQIQQECANIVGIPEGLLRCGAHLKDHPAYSKFSHCVALRSGSAALKLSDNSIRTLIKP
uniref:Uncharacterized protein n=1 Tax=Anopheles culicifacies TaxID=139723 RepID=A0A182MS21_9DIPT